MKTALVLFSGGQDSVVSLYWAKEHFSQVQAITFDYCQRHRIEIESAKTITKMARVPHEVVTIGPLLKGASPLVNLVNDVGTYESADVLPGGVEPTFVPGRNLLFLVLAANRAACFNNNYLVTGLCKEDFGGYFDCRQVFIDVMAKALSQGIHGTDDTFKIHTPLMNLTKRESVLMAKSFSGCMEALAFSHTCYNGVCPPCGKCHACLLRARGFTEAGIPDPLVERVGVAS